MIFQGLKELLKESAEEKGGEVGRLDHQFSFTFFSFTFDIDGKVERADHQYLSFIYIDFFRGRKGRWRGRII